MKLSNPLADIFIPDNEKGDPFARITHLGIGAHQDDLEIMASHGICQCYRSKDLFFGGVTCTNGAGSARIGKFRNYSDQQMIEVRQIEQKKAAKLGHYGAMIQLNYSSAQVKSDADNGLIPDLTTIIKATKPQVIYTHNIFDKHSTHQAICKNVIKALRGLSVEERPKSFYGCEVWRGLDWLDDTCKVPLDLSGHERFVKKLISVYRSQVEGGKRYDLATLGRMRANATYFESHATDNCRALWFAIDMFPLIDGQEIEQFVREHIERFKVSVLN